MAALTLAAVAAIGWLAILATGRRESAHEAIEARQHALQVAAQFASSEILKEINRRFDILNQLASDAELRQQMVEIKETAEGRGVVEAARGLARRSQGGPRERRGRRIVGSSTMRAACRWPAARAAKPRAARTLRTAIISPAKARICRPRRRTSNRSSRRILSAVYRSTSTGHLKVAFSVPIENGKKGKEREVIGVLAMSGRFRRVQRAGEETAEGARGRADRSCANRRSTAQTRRGLILHHQREEPYRKGAAAAVGRQRSVGADRGAAQEDRQRSARKHGAMLTDYRDDALTNGKLYWGALQPVVDRGRDEPVREATGWCWCRSRSRAAMNGRLRASSPRLCRGFDADC